MSEVRIFDQIIKTIDLDNKKIKKGSKIVFKENHEGNIDTLRPSDGLNIKYLDFVRNSKASKDLIAGTPLKSEDIVKR